MSSRTWVGATFAAILVASLAASSAAAAGHAVRPAGRQAGAPAPCHGSDLRVTLGRAEGTAGTTYQRIHVRNVGPIACTISGYPRVSFRSGSGRLVGLPSLHENFTGVPIRVITIGAGGVAHTDVAIPDPGVFPRHLCKPHDAERLRFTPPHRAIRHGLAIHVTVCTTGHGRTAVGPMRRGRGM